MPGKLSPLDQARLRQQAIGVRLRFMFNDIIEQPVPQEWLDLLRKADERLAAEAEGSADGR